MHRPKRVSVVRKILLCLCSCLLVPGLSQSQVLAPVEYGESVSLSLLGFRF